MPERGSDRPTALPTVHCSPRSYGVGDRGGRGPRHTSGKVAGVKLHPVPKGKILCVSLPEPALVVPKEQVCQRTVANFPCPDASGSCRRLTPQSPGRPPWGPSPAEAVWVGPTFLRNTRASYSPRTSLRRNIPGAPPFAKGRPPRVFGRPPVPALSEHASCNSRPLLPPRWSGGRETSHNEQKRVGS